MYISVDERGGFKVVKVNLPLPDARLRHFIQGKEDWLEGLLVSARKNKEKGL
jgi:predicted metal-dependent hydrolase